MSAALALALRTLARGGRLDREGAAEAMGAVMDGEATPVQIAGFLLGLRSRGESAEEIVGCARAIRSRALPFPSTQGELVDTCGTGGDGASTFNISTTAAFVAAGAGCTVAKHGNRAVSSRAGSADVLEALGVEIDLAGPEAAAALGETGITFLFAPAFHAAMRHAGPVRRELGVRTIFNVLGPLCNPAGATRQLVGVFDGELAPVLAGVLGELGAERALVVHGSDGLDELTVSGPSLVAEWDGREVRRYEVTPEQVGLARHPAEALRGGSAEENAEILRGVLAGQPGAARDVTLLNAGAAILAAGRAPTLGKGVELARESVDSGAAARALEELVRYSTTLRTARLARVEAAPAAPLGTGWGR
jgi:anthranilate phosphoribosyltransferase